MDVAPQERFTETVDDYARYRPGYPRALVDWIVATAGLKTGAHIVDVGCGTGISSRLFAERGFAVTGVDPNDAMLAKAREEGGATYIRGEATATGLPDHSADLVTVAQAFHWLDVPPSLREFARILIPGGWCCAFWNARADTPFLAEYDALLKRYSTEYERAMGGRKALARLKEDPSVADLLEATFPNHQVFDWAGLRGRAWSSSYVVHGVADASGLERELRDLFDRFAGSGSVRFDYQTNVYAWRFR